jgi:GGDEF domain-containing protein
LILAGISTIKPDYFDFATYPEDGLNTHALIDHADQVMYAAKKNRGSLRQIAHLNHF